MLNFQVLRILIRTIKSIKFVNARNNHPLVQYFFKKLGSFLVKFVEGVPFALEKKVVAEMIQARDSDVT